MKVLSRGREGRVREPAVVGAIVEDMIHPIHPLSASQPPPAGEKVERPSGKQLSLLRQMKPDPDPLPEPGTEGVCERVTSELSELNRMCS